MGSGNARSFDFNLKKLEQPLRSQACGAKPVGLEKRPATPSPGAVTPVTESFPYRTHADPQSSLTKAADLTEYTMNANQWKWSEPRAMLLGAVIFAIAGITGVPARTQTMTPEAGTTVSQDQQKQLDQLKVLSEQLQKDRDAVHSAVTQYGWDSDQVDEAQQRLFKNRQEYRDLRRSLRAAGVGLPADAPGAAAGGPSGRRSMCGSGGHGHHGCCGGGGKCQGQDSGCCCGHPM